MSQRAGGVPGVLVLLQVGDGHVGPLLGEGHGDGAADPGVAAGDQRGAAVEEAAALVVGHLVARLGLHALGAARVLLLLRRKLLLCHGSHARSGVPAPARRQPRSVPTGARRRGGWTSV